MLSILVDNHCYLRLVHQGAVWQLVQQRNILTSMLNDSENLFHVFVLTVWFDMDNEKNTNVYVTGLPTDITDDEYLELMNKVGLVASDPVTRKLKLKLYRNPDGGIKGDGRCCYLKVCKLGSAFVQKCF